MTDPLELALAGLVGAGLGVVFFGGLWWTVLRGVSSPHPVLWFLGSGLLRTGVVLAGLYVVSGGQWRRLVAALLGFIAARFAVMRLTRPPAELPDSRKSRGGHAP